MTGRFTEETQAWSGPMLPLDVAQLADHHALCRLAQTYALGMDMRDYALCRSVFSADAQIEDRSGTLVAIDSLLPGLFDSASRYAVTQHNVTNQYVALDGTSARMWSYAIAYHRPAKGDELGPVTVGVIYKDACRRGDDGWLIDRRSVAIEWLER